MIRGRPDGRKSPRGAGGAMTPSVGIMSEGQEGLTWGRWRALARAVEGGGYESLFRSDHLTGLFGEPRRAALDTWASLTWLATGTSRIRFGPLVCPLTFYHPALLAKRAAAVDQLSGGRLDLGVGAGWHEPEHRMYGIPFPSMRERLDRLECGVRVIRALGEGRPVIVGRSASETAARLEKARAVFPRLPEDAAGWRGAGFLHGSPADVVADLGRWRELGVQRVMLQMIDQEDLAAIELIAREVLPALG